jgi:hypothetical protein
VAVIAQKPSALVRARLRGVDWAGIAVRCAVVLATLVAVTTLLVFEIVAVGNHYELRVTADTPTFLALIRDLGQSPFRPDSVFFGTSGSASIHASPYLQLLGLIWRIVAPAGRYNDPIAIGEYAAVVTIPVTLFVLTMTWLYARELAGRAAAWGSVLGLLTLFGPVHIAYPSDLTFNGFLSTGYFPTTFATGLTLAALICARRQTLAYTAATAALTALTLTTDPFNGTVLVALLVLYSCVAATRLRTEAYRLPAVILAGLFLARAWPEFNIFSSLQAQGLGVPKVVAAVAVAPSACRWGWSRLAPATARARAVVRHLHVGPETELRLAKAGFWGACLIAVWGIYKMTHWPSGVPVLGSYRLGFYWNDQRDRWLLLFLPGICAVLGLARVARTRTSFPLLWLGSLYGVGAIGAAVHLATGFQLPLYYRFILLCQLPAAIGIGAYLARNGSRRAALVVLATLLASLAFKATTLATVSTRLNYFGSQLSTLWQFDRVIPPRSGVVASDPSTSYFIPITTRNRVLTFGMGHADSGSEPELAKSGYVLLRTVWAGNGTQATRALVRMWNVGVRWVVVEKFTTLQPPTQMKLFWGPYNALIGGTDINPLARYNARLAIVGRQTFDNGEFTVYRLNGRRLSRAVRTRPTIGVGNIRRVHSLLVRLVAGDTATAAVTEPSLYRLGVRFVALSYGELGSTPTLTAFGGTLGSADVVTLPVRNGRWAVDCVPECYFSYPSSEVERLGTVLHNDGRFSTIVSLRRPG